MNYAGKVVVVTGASSGIGEESAIEFAKRKANVILVARRKEKLDQVAQKISKYNSQVMTLQCDVSQKSQVESMSKTVLEKTGRIDILVNNAGFAIYGTVADLKVEEIESQIATNFFGMIYCTKAFLPKMLDQKSGHIVNVASVAASFGLPGMASYCASKFAMLGFSEGLYHELKGTGVGVTVVSPIMVRTNFFDNTSFKSVPKYSPTSLSSKTVAKAVIKAASSSRLEIIVPPFVRVAVWAKQTFPYLINPILTSIFKQKQEKDSD
ncbi:MAG: SDR family NAD(P)-dependent oxidoreductase [Marine Group I thaumarchaeote]|nr:MAG: SDR family NAD(P)-dependent oxidoreductase [Marine Group I thaumarchaeote]